VAAPSILFSADELNPARVDEPFEPQAAALRQAGFRCWVLPPQRDRLVTRGDTVAGTEILFRGWMMTPTEYLAFEAMCTAAGAALVVNAQAYAAAHHISGWLNTISDLTPQTVLLPAGADLRTELGTLGWSQFFIKDFVKSLKTSRGSIAHSPDDAVALVEEMLSYRGEIEGGFAIRQVEAFVPETERRYFVLDGRPHSPIVGESIPPIVVEVAKRFTASRFFSVDVVQTVEGRARVVEIGDGQVSDLVGWAPERFAAMLAEHWPAA